MTLTTIFLVPLLSLLSLQSLLSQPLPFPPPSSLDSHLQSLAFKAFFNPRTGVPYDAKLPENLTGISLSAMRLKSGSLFTRGVRIYGEFEIPIGVIEHPYVERLVLVYQNLGNWSQFIYPLPNYTYLAPVLGLLAYSASNLNASMLPELQLRASKTPILIKFPNVKPQPLGSSAKCVHFDLHGSVNFSALLFPGNVCSTFQQGHFSIVVGPSAPSGGGKNRSSAGLRILIPCLVGGLLLVIVLGVVVVVAVWRTKRGTRIRQLECETLQIRDIGGTKAPLAVGTRTRPVIENDYTP